jgi:hypothetical protein
MGMVATPALVAYGTTIAGVLAAVLRWRRYAASLTLGVTSIVQESTRMAESDVDLLLLERLVRSSTWREYRDRVLLPAYGRVAQTLDVVREDHRYLQGLKEGLRLAMEEPYRLLGLPSPLETSSQMTRRARERVKTRADAAQEDMPAHANARTSYLA